MVCFVCLQVEYTTKTGQSCGSIRRTKMACGKFACLRVCLLVSCLSVCLSVRLFLCLHVCPSVCVCVCVCLSVCLPVGLPVCLSVYVYLGEGGGGGWGRYGRGEFRAQVLRNAGMHSS
jgi:hypothetical protein